MPHESCAFSSVTPTLQQLPQITTFYLPAMLIFVDLPFAFALFLNVVVSIYMSDWLI